MLCIFIVIEFNLLCMPYLQIPIFCELQTKQLKRVYIQGVEYVMWFWIEAQINLIQSESVETRKKALTPVFP